MTVFVALSGCRQGRLQVLQGGRGQERRGRHPRGRVASAQGDRLMRQLCVVITKGNIIGLSTRALHHVNPRKGVFGMEAAVSCCARDLRSC